MVLRKSFVRIRELQTQLAEAHAAVAEAAELREGLAGAQERLEDLQGRFADEVRVSGCLFVHVKPLDSRFVLCMPMFDATV